MAASTATPGLTLGPMDPDGASVLTARLGVHNSAKHLLKASRAAWPAELVRALARPRDDDRSEALDMDEVLDALRSLRGRQAFFNDATDALEDASVRGARPADRVVSVVYRRGGEFGRSAQGVIPYAGLERSIKAYEELLEDRKAVLRGGAAPVRPDEDTAAVAAAREAESARRDAEAELTELRARLERLENPEPFAGWDSLTAKDRVEAIREGGVGEYGRAGLENMRDYEGRQKRPSTPVLAAITEALQG